MDGLPARHYVPVLRGKRGEYQALENLDTSARELTTPLLELPAVPWDYAKDASAKDIDSHLAGTAQQIRKAWDDRKVFLDLYALEAEGPMSTGQDPASYIFDACRQEGVSAIPVMGLARAPIHQEAVRSAISHDRRGCCLRLLPDDFGSGAFPQAEVEELLRTVGADPGTTDLLLDFGPLGHDRVGMLVLEVHTCIDAVPSVDQWRSLIWAGTAFPRYLSGLVQNGISLVERIEWLLWSRLVSERTLPRRIPTYGDYAVAHPEQLDVDPRLITMVPNIRYADDEQWVILRGRDSKKAPAAQQTPGLCRALMSRQEWHGAAFSWGDDYISQCSSGRAGPGNATTWRAVGTNHHLTLAANQVANVPGI